MQSRLHTGGCSMLIAAALSGAGCQAPGTSTQGHPTSMKLGSAQAQRAEQVFRLQNRVMDDLISQTMALSDAPTRDLMTLEDRMIVSCSALNEAADMQAMGTSPGAILRIRVLGSLSECEDSARAARAAMTLKKLPPR